MQINTFLFHRNPLCLNPTASSKWMNLASFWPGEVKARYGSERASCSFLLSGWRHFIFQQVMECLLRAWTLRLFIHSRLLKTCARHWGYSDGQGCDPYRFQPRIKVAHPKKKKKVTSHWELWKRSSGCYKSLNRQVWFKSWELERFPRREMFKLKSQGCI